MSVNWNDSERDHPSDIAIYGLIDPVTNILRYVGQTTNPEARFKQHMSTEGRQCNPEKAQWIETLRAEGLEPRMDILGFVAKQDAYAMEMLTIWIVKGKLTNRVRPTERQMRRIGKHIAGHAVWGPIFRDAGVFE